MLNEARVNTGYFHQVHYQRIKSKTKCNNVKAIIINSWTTIGIFSLQQQKLYIIPPFIYMDRISRKTKPIYKKLENLIKCRFAVFKEKDKHQKLFFKDDNLKNIEITFEMALNGALHNERPRKMES